MIYADASAIVKRYREETGSPRVREAWLAAERVFTSWVSYAEVHAALARKQRERGLTPAEFRTAAHTFEGEWPAYDQIAVNATTLAAVLGDVASYDYLVIRVPCVSAQSSLARPGPGLSSRSLHVPAGIRVSLTGAVHVPDPRESRESADGADRCAVSQEQIAIREHRIWASPILDLFASGWSTAESLENYPGLQEVDLLVCIAYGAEISRERYADLPVGLSA
jgi:uncharacterized protein (DUF433 family)/uncharacterized protein with PIN domain